jgi:hypothetical protein
MKKITISNIRLEKLGIRSYPTKDDNNNYYYYISYDVYINHNLKLPLRHHAVIRKRNKKLKLTEKLLLDNETFLSSKSIFSHVIKNYQSIVTYKIGDYI